MEDYYIDEIPIVIDEYAELSKMTNNDEEEVGAEDFQKKGILQMEDERKKALLILAMLNWLNTFLISILLITRFFCNQ